MCYHHCTMKGKTSDIIPNGNEPRNEEDIGSESHWKSKFGLVSIYIDEGATALPIPKSASICNIRLPLR